MKSFGNLVESYAGLPSNANDLQSWFYSASNLYSGSTGVIELDANGDRANGTFDFWGMQNNNGNYEWVFVGQSE
jgi:branched-chain amino acid transport system substrate-binding protein